MISNPSILISENTIKDEFYPTPEKLANKMLDGIDWDFVQTVLEPSAGKGNLIKAAIQKHKHSQRSYRVNELDIDCIELDQNLQHILKGEGYRVIADDFLKYETYKRYDLILMNPPFSEGDKHLLKALKMQRRGGSIVCLLNAEMIKNPYSNNRRELNKVLNNYHAQIEYVSHAFKSAERKTDVEIAVIKIAIPQAKEESDIYDNLKKSKNLDEYLNIRNTDIALNDFIKAAVAQFNVEAGAGVELIRQYRNLTPYISKVINPKEPYQEEPLLTLIANDGRSRYRSIGVNEYLKLTRLKYWEALLTNPKFVGKLTSNLQSEYHDMVQKLKDYDFSEYNINMIAADMNININRGIEDTIMSMFDRLTCDHAYYPECKNNVHYYNGWSHNKAHRINKKVILPAYGVWNTWDKKFRSYQAKDMLQDIEKVLDFLDGNMTANVDLSSAIEAARENPKNIRCKYFTVTFYKKGTVHIVFDNLELLEKFNIYAAKNRKWLPPYYGKKEYSEMNTEEKAVVNEFQGEKVYSKVMKNKGYYFQDVKVPQLCDTSMYS